MSRNQIYTHSSNKNSSNDFIFDDELNEEISYKEMKNRINTKIRSIYTQNVSLEEENKILSKEIESLKHNIHEMIPNFSSNTSNSFPMLTELQIIINDYIKIICQDIFFDLLQPNFNFEEVIYFYKSIFNNISQITIDYFSPIENIIKETLFIDILWEPIDNVLKKSYQTNWNIYYNEYQKNINYRNLINEINNKLNLNSDKNIFVMIKQFLEKTSEIFFLCYICEPKINININQIGKEVKFNNLIHDSMDGFIKSKQNSIIILPVFYKGKDINNESIIIKSQVLGKDYVLPGD